MADTGIFATTAEVIRKAGIYASAVSSAEAYTNDFMTQAESYINAITCYNWSDNYVTLNVDIKGILKEAASSLAAIYVINYDMSGFSSMREAETMLDVLSERVNSCIQQLKEAVVRNFIKTA